jgi:hypothetical protein
MSSKVRSAAVAVVVIVALAAVPCPAAGTGWYLLVPPSSDYDEHAQFLQAYTILDMKPLYQWAQQGAYDSASECEAVRNSLLMVEHRFYAKSSEDYVQAIGANKDPAVLTHMRRTTERSNANVDAFTASRCIKSDDPRLRK